MVLDRFCPDERVPSVASISLDELVRSGVKGVILDLDNTLVPWDGEELDPAAVAWVETAKSRGLKLCIASNSIKSRVEEIASSLGLPAIPKAVKPRKRPFRRALEILGTEPHETVVIGDQLFTDVFGGNRLALHTILITPLSENELLTTRMVRRVERRVVSHLEKKGRLRQQQDPRPDGEQGA